MAVICFHSPVDEIVPVLEDNKSSAAYAAPEMMGHWWEEVGKNLEKYLGEPDVKWKQTVVDIITDKEAATEATTEVPDNYNFDVVAEFLGTHKLLFKFFNEFGNTAECEVEAIMQGRKQEDTQELVGFYLEPNGVIENQIHPDAEVRFEDNVYLVTDATPVHGKISIIIARPMGEDDGNCRKDQV